MEIYQNANRYYKTLTKGDLQISICIHLPETQTDETPSGIIFLHSLNGCKLGPNDLFPYLADELSSIGFYSVRFDYIGNGESSWIEDADLKSKAEDTEYVVDYICREFGVARVFLITISSSASLVFYLKEGVKKIDNIVFLSPIFTHDELSSKPISMLNLRLLEYFRKLFNKRTYARLIKREIDFKAVFKVLKNSILPNKLTPKITTVDSQKTGPMSSLKSIPAMLIIGSLDPYCRNNLKCYESYINKNRFNWTRKVLEGSGHNYSSLSERNKVVSLIREFITASE